MTGIDEKLHPAFFEEMVESVGVGVAIYDESGAYRYVNDAYAELLETTREALVGTPLWEVVPAIEADRFDGYWGSFDENETRKAETEHVYQGRSVPVKTITTRRQIEGTPYHFGTIQDISDQRAYERSLERKNERLEAFTGVVGHDLRNPLNVAEGYLALAREDCNNEHLEMVESALSRMDTLLEDLLTLAREGRAIDEREPLSLSEAVRDAWANVRTHGGTLAVEVEGTVRADEQRLLQIFENLFRNSLEHGGETVRVRVGRLESNGGFYVEDDGPGIPPDQRESVFRPGATTSDDGTGFGLAIVNEVAEAHGWSVSLAESDDGGARFEFTGVDFVESSSRR